MEVRREPSASTPRDRRWPACNASVEGADAKTDIGVDYARRPPADRSRSHRRRQVAAVGPEMDAGEPISLNPAAEESAWTSRTTSSMGSWPAPRVTGMMRIRATLFAPGLHAERERGPAGPAGSIAAPHGPSPSPVTPSPTRRSPSHCCARPARRLEARPRPPRSGGITSGDDDADAALWRDTLIACRAPWSAVAVTEQVLDDDESASGAAVGVPPRARNSSSTATSPPGRPGSRT